MEQQQIKKSESALSVLNVLEVLTHLNFNIDDVRETSRIYSLNGSSVTLTTDGRNAGKLVFSTISNAHSYDANGKNVLEIIQFFRQAMRGNK